MRVIIVSIVLAAFAGTSLQVPATAFQIDPMPFMPKPGTMVHLSSVFTPAYLKGIVVHPENALKFDFIITRGDRPLTDEQKKIEYNKLAKYFLASLAIPDDDQWVNLSPYEKDRIIKDDFGKTEMGRDLLSQDYMLKQITASLIYPESQIGKEFWKRVYAKAQKQYGTTNIPVNTFNKVWILPDDALIYEKGNCAYVLKSHLKVMLEEDYLSLKKHTGIQNVIASEAKQSYNTHSLASQIIKQLVLPQLEREVNEGANFVALRQVYSGMLLAAWYKRALKASLLNMIYANKAKVKGVDQDPRTNEAIYHQYLKAYQKGVFNFIKEEPLMSSQTVARKYFSGGTQGYKDYPQIVHKLKKLDSAQLAAVSAEASQLDYAQVAADESQQAASRVAAISQAPNTNAAMTSSATPDDDQPMIAETFLNKGRRKLTLKPGDQFEAIDVLVRVPGKSDIHIGTIKREKGRYIFFTDNFKRVNLDKEKLVESQGFVISVDKKRNLSLQNNFKYPQLIIRIEYSLQESATEDESATINGITIRLKHLAGEGEKKQYGLFFVYHGHPKQFLIGITSNEAAKAVLRRAMNLALQPDINFNTFYTYLTEYTSKFFYQREEDVNGLILKIYFDPNIDRYVLESSQRRLLLSYDAGQAKSIFDAVVRWASFNRPVQNIFAQARKLVANQQASDNAMTVRSQETPAPLTAAVDRAMTENGTRPKIMAEANINGIYVAYFFSPYEKGYKLDFEWSGNPKLSIPISVSNDPHVARKVFNHAKKLAAKKEFDNPTDTIEQMEAMLKDYQEARADLEKYAKQLQEGLVTNPSIHDRAITENSTRPKIIDEEKVSGIDVAFFFSPSQNIYGLIFERSGNPKLSIPMSDDPYLAREVFNHAKELAAKKEFDNPTDTIEQSKAMLKEARGDLEQYIQQLLSKQGDPDRAMKATVQNPLEPENPGGIDFNATHLNLQIKRDGRGVPLAIAAQDLKNIHLDGLIPVIIDIKPVAQTSLLSLLIKGT